MVARKRGARRGALVERWELELVRKVAHVFRTHEREELEAELTRKLLVLKENPSKDIRNWKHYVTKFLYNKASNWVRDARTRDSRYLRVVDMADEESVMGFISENFLAAPEPNDDLAITLAEVWNQLSPELRSLWTYLVEEDGNQIAAAFRLHKHRNTVRLWIRKIQTILRRHGLDEHPF